MNKLISALLLLGYAVGAHAASVPQLENYLDREISRIDEAMATDATPADADHELWYLKNFWLRIKPRASFEIPGIAKIEVIPEAELLWQRQLPDGFSPYKP